MLISDRQDKAVLAKGSEVFILYTSTGSGGINGDNSR